MKTTYTNEQLQEAIDTVDTVLDKTYRASKAFVTLARAFLANLSDGQLPTEKPDPLVTKSDSLPEWTPRVGEVVRLKSGGPLMTMRVIDKDDPSDSWCHWFDGNRSCLELFPTACLELSTKENGR